MNNLCQSELLQRSAQQLWVFGEYCFYLSRESLHCSKLLTVETVLLEYEFRVRKIINVIRDPDEDNSKFIINLIDTYDNLMSLTVDMKNTEGHRVTDRRTKFSNIKDAVHQPYCEGESFYEFIILLHCGTIMSVDTEYRQPKIWDDRKYTALFTHQWLYAIDEAGIVYRLDCNLLWTPANFIFTNAKYTFSVDRSLTYNDGRFCHRWGTNKVTMVSHYFNRDFVPISYANHRRHRYTRFAVVDSNGNGYIMYNNKTDHRTYPLHTNAAHSKVVKLELPVPMKAVYTIRNNFVFHGHDDYFYRVTGINYHDLKTYNGANDSNIPLVIDILGINTQQPWYINNVRF